MLDVIAHLLRLDLLLAFHGVRSGLKSLLMNQLPRCLGSSIHNSALIVPPQSILQVGRVADVITAISFALKYVDEISHVPKEKPAVKKQQAFQFWRGDPGY